MGTTIQERPTTKALIKRLHARRVAEEDRLRARRAVMNELRSTMNWLAVFQEEYDLPDEVVLQFRTRFEKLAALMNRV